MWDTSPAQASLHRISGDGWGQACLSAHQAPPTLLITLSFTLGRVMFQAPSCSDNLFKPFQGMNMQFFQERICSLLCNSQLAQMGCC